MVKEAIIKFAEESYLKFLWRKWNKDLQPGRAAYFRFSCTVTVRSEDGTQSLSGPQHLLTKIYKNQGAGETEDRDLRDCAMRLMSPFWGDIAPNAALLIEITESEEQRLRGLRPLAVERYGAVFDVLSP